MDIGGEWNESGWLIDLKLLNNGRRAQLSRNSLESSVRYHSWTSDDSLKPAKRLADARNKRYLQALRRTFADLVSTVFRNFLSYQVSKQTER